MSGLVAAVPYSDDSSLGLQRGEAVAKYLLALHFVAGDILANQIVTSRDACAGAARAEEGAVSWHLHNAAHLPEGAAVIGINGCVA